jgi:hypothetical protein
LTPSSSAHAEKSYYVINPAISVGIDASTSICVFELNRPVRHTFALFFSITIRRLFPRIFSGGLMKFSPLTLFTVSFGLITNIFAVPAQTAQDSMDGNRAVVKAGSEYKWSPEQEYSIDLSTVEQGSWQTVTIPVEAFKFEEAALSRVSRRFFSSTGPPEKPIPEPSILTMSNVMMYKFIR